MLVRAKACKEKVQIVINIIINISYIIRVSIQVVDDRLGAIFKHDKSYNFYITIS